MSREVQELLSDPTKGKSRAHGILCYLFRHVLLWRRVDQFSWNKRLKQYFKRPHNANEKRDKGNMNKALSGSEFTWGTFKKAIDFLNPHTAVFVIELKWRDGRVSRYQVVIDPAEDESDQELNSFEPPPACEVFKRDTAKANKKPLSTLSRLFRQIVAEEVKVAKRWEALLDAYVRNPLNGIPQTSKDIHQQLSILQRDLNGRRMSWDIFRKGLLILDPVEQTFALQLTWNKEGTDMSVHSVTMRDPLSVVPTAST